MALVVSFCHDWTWRGHDSSRALAEWRTNRLRIGMWGSESGRGVCSAVDVLNDAGIQDWPGFQVADGPNGDGCVVGIEAGVAVQKFAYDHAIRQHLQHSIRGRLVEVAQVVSSLLQQHTHPWRSVWPCIVTLKAYPPTAA